MSAAARALVRRLVVLAIELAVLIVAHVVAVHALVAWDAGGRLLAGGTSSVEAATVLLAFFALRLAVYLVAPPLVAVGVVRAIARFRRDRASDAGPPDQPTRRSTSAT